MVVVELDRFVETQTDGVGGEQLHQSSGVRRIIDGGKGLY